LIETLLIYLGVVNYGAIICPVNIDESKENVYRLLDLAKPRIVFYRKQLVFDQERYSAGSWIPYTDFDVENRQENEFFSMLKNYDTVFQNTTGSKDDIMVIVFTSGTTGVAKGVVHSRESLCYIARTAIDRMKITENDIILDYRAYNWASTQTLSILPGLIVGATVIFAKGFSRTRFSSWLKEYGVTICIGVPTVLNFLLEKPVALHKKDVPSLRFITSSTAPLLTKNQLEFEKKYGILLNQLAGSAESGVIAINDSEELKHPERRKIGSIGKAPLYREVYILDDDGKRCKAGEVGEIVVKGKSNALGYLQADGTVSRFSEDGVPTGDFGFIDSDGYIYITGRKKDIIIRGGVNIAPMEITAWLMEHPAVQEAVTIGVPDEAYGEEVASFIVPKAGHKVDEESILNHSKKKLPDFKLPKTVCFVDEIPKTERQKVAKAGLLKFWEEQRKSK
jgi:acyl-coenzyme A synthetase/AMP-(fatty) acid ligase